MLEFHFEGLSLSVMGEKKKMSFGSQVQRMVCVPGMKTPAAAKSPVWKYQLAGEGN